MSENERRPDYAVPPGATLAEWLEEHRMKQSELASRINLSEKALSQIISGWVPLTRQTASKLELVTGVPARTWNKLESYYQEANDQLAQVGIFEAQSDWLADLPVKQLRDLDIVTAPRTDKAGIVRQLLEFFGVSDVAAWKRLWLGPQAVGLRQSEAFDAHPGAVAAWLRMGEIEADRMTVGEYDARALREVLPQLRQLTLEPDPDVFVDELIGSLADVGVALVFVPEVTGARCAGAARWVHGRPVVQLSLRFGSDDQMWFTLFHEVAHILLHGKKDVFITDGSTNRSEHGDKEDEADTFARDLLVPRRFAAELPQLRSETAIVEFAQRTGVSPGIVVGRLEHDKVIDYRFGAHLKNRYTLDESPAVDVPVSDNDARRNSG